MRAAIKFKWEKKTFTIKVAKATVHTFNCTTENRKTSSGK